MSEIGFQGNWIETNEASDVAGSIRHVIRSADRVGQDPQEWKWVVLALHSALQGACVCHLTGSAQPVGAVTEKNAADWLAYFDATRTNPETKRPKTQLMSLPELLKAVREPYSAGDRSNAEGVALSDSEFAWLKNFHKDIRNQFVHFAPMGWSIEVSGIPEIAKLIARAIKEIIEIGYAFRRLDPALRDSLRNNLDRLAAYDWPTGTL